MPDFTKVLPVAAEYVDNLINQNSTDDTKRIAFALVVFDTTGEEMQAHMASNAPRDRVVRALLEFAIASNQELN